MRLIAAALLTLLGTAALAQSGLLPPNTVQAGPPTGSSQGFARARSIVATDITLASGQVLIGQAGGLAAPKALSGDCTLVAAGSIVCTKTNGATLTTLATTAPGTGVATALGVNVGTAGAFVVNGGALGTPSSGVGTNLTALNGSNISTGTVANARLTGSGAATVAGVSCALGSTCALSSLSNSTSTSIALNNTGSYFDGPSVAQGTSGTWYATGTATVSSPTADTMICKLWDGTTVAAIAVQNLSAGFNATLSMSGVFTSPAANIRISCRDSSTTSGSMVSTADGVVKASTINVLRIN